MINESITLVGAVSLSFAITYLILPRFNEYMRAIGVVGIDVMKKNKTPVVDMGGPSVITGFLSGVFYYLGVEIFINPPFTDARFVLAGVCTVMIITLIGIFDSLTALSKKREGEGEFEQYKKVGIPRWLYFFIPLPAAIPIMSVKAGVSYLALPFLGRVDFGILYPLVLVPLGVLCCSNATNFLAGFNGLEAGMGFVLHLSVGVFTYFRGLYVASVMSFCFAFTLLAFLRYNWYPAKVFPGDLNYTIGAVFASITVIGNIEKFAILCFTLYIIEALLKAYSKFDAESYGVLQPDGTVKPRSDKIRGLTHIVMRLGNYTEEQVTLILIGAQVVVCLASFYLVTII